MTDRDIFLIEVARRGRDGDYAGAAEVATLQGRATALEARVDITSLGDIPDVVGTPTAGQALVYDGTDSRWEPTTVGLPVAATSFGTTVEDDIRFINTAFGLTASGDEPFPGFPRVTLEVDFAGTGSVPTVARSDHWHNVYAPTRATFGPMGYMSSGTRSLGSTSVVLPAGIWCIVKAKINMQIRGGDPGACYYQLRLTINGDARTSLGGTSGFWCVQGVPDKTTWEHHIAMSGTGAAVTVSADVIYHSGGGFYTDAGEIAVDIDAAK